VRRSDLGCRYNLPLRIEPALGQISEDDSEISSGHKPWDVFQESVAWSHLANDADRLRPEIAIVAPSELPAGLRERLAREACSDDIHEATPLSPVEGSDVVPDREQVQHAVSLPAQEHLSAVRLFFHGGNATPSEEPGPEEAPTSSGK
jgi:hypothetical protein